MIIFAALIASGQVLPWLDRPWLNERVRLEAAASPMLINPIKSRPAASPAGVRKLESFENTLGM
ncbi:MAG TPA: hypothetical protein VK364_02045 [Hymenobacter sp.]|nr:hypothetical protein [Hymenobacter sp.]